MTRDSINVQYPSVETTQSVGSVVVTKTAISASNGAVISKAFANKNNTLFICVDNTANAAANITFKAGDAYPNAMLGDLSSSVGSGKTVVFQIQDISRFENKDGSLNIDFAVGFTGYIYAVAKPTTLNS